MSGPTQKYISVIGAGICDQATEDQAEEVGRLTARAGAVLICGGMGGVMEAASRGAKSEGGVTIGVLPGLDRADGNHWLDYSLCTGIGHARNLTVAASADVLIAIGGEFGTLSEIGLGLKCGRRVVLLGSWDVSRNGQVPEDLLTADSPTQALLLALED